MRRGGPNLHNGVGGEGTAGKRLLLPCVRPARGVTAAPQGKSRPFLLYPSGGAAWTPPRGTRVLPARGGCEQRAPADPPDGAGDPGRASSLPAVPAREPRGEGGKGTGEEAAGRGHLVHRLPLPRPGAVPAAPSGPPGRPRSPHPAPLPEPGPVPPDVPAGGWAGAGARPGGAGRSVK